MAQTHRSESRRNENFGTARSAFEQKESQLIAKEACVQTGTFIRERAVPKQLKECTMLKRILVTTTVLFATFSFLLPAKAHEHGMMKEDIVDVAVANGSFNTLVAAVKAAGLVDTLKGEGPFTVFAPTDEAFAKLPDGTVDMLLMPDNKDKLVAILTYHVVPGKVMAADVVKMDKATTVQGQDVMIKTMGDKVMINNATVIATDVKAKNGVIHVIDEVIMPK
ncbi:LOW QUALITY PROTEIN: secreted and surface protein containing fasciclin-like repeats [Vibrio sp. JCM 19052]|nr:LOW QUALITY PROTEIN: secreted and surface protein containing fasciclin-like repeats [Vibrio sp. JCM 19052]